MEIFVLVLVAFIALFIGRYARAILQWMQKDQPRFDPVLLDEIPALLWIEQGGKVVWSNSVFSRVNDTAKGKLNIESFTLTEPLSSDGKQARGQLAGQGPRRTMHFDISKHKVMRQSFYVAVSAKAAVIAEEDRVRFVQTLSETFAHLPIGMAVFDKERDLSLFNPALAQLLDVSTIWLANKPSLRAFLDRLHDKGALPEPRNFKSWRDQITEMEISAESGTYFDDWHMPNDKIFRVTGRPHPKGAVAFIFEDISRTVAAEREYRVEIERLYAALDIMETGIIVFDGAGSLSFANDTFDAIWGTDYSKSLMTPTAVEVAQIWNQRSLPSPVLGEIRNFITSIGERENWNGVLAKSDDEKFEVRAIPMAGNYSMVEFRSLNRR